MTNPLVSIIVVTMNTPKLTGACLDSVIQNTGVPYELIVVSNSPAQGIKKCLGNYPGIRIISNERNLGYTKAANQGIKEACGKFVCFLNSDTLVPPKWMERMLTAVRKPKVGAVGPVSNIISWTERWLSNLSVNQSSVSLIDETFQRWYSDENHKISWLNGFCLMIPKSIIEHVGCFDERFFFGWEDLDYSLRLRLNGYRLIRLKTVFVYHQTEGSSSHAERNIKLNQAARCQFFLKWRHYLSSSPANYLSLAKKRARNVLVLEWMKFRSALENEISMLSEAV